MANAICQREPWSVNVFPYRPDESVDGHSAAGEITYFYLYDTLPLKLGVKLPFTHFERSVLCALNVAPTTLHPNSWDFVRAFKLLCEDVGRAPSLSVFFWFFSIRKVDRVGWTSLSGRPKHKLFKSFLEIVRKDVEEWENEFIEELSHFPVLLSTDIIKGVEEDVSTDRRRGESASLPISTAEPDDATQASVESTPKTPLMVILDSPDNSSRLAEIDLVLSKKCVVNNMAQACCR
ncbi:hypothetical protein CR513_48277, partial [Mucuna pruriens]